MWSDMLQREAARMLGERLLELRKQRGFTQDEVGAGIGLTKSSVCHIEKGRRPLTGEHLIRAARLLRVPVRELVAAESRQ